MKRAIFIFIITVFAHTARADYHYASPNGSNVYPYTSWETAAWLVQDALDASESYDTVYVGAGQYYEQIEMQPEDSCVTIIGAGMDSVLIWTDVNDILFRKAQRTSFIDLGFRHLGTSAAKIIERRYFTGPNTDLYVNRCRFSGGLNVTAIMGLFNGVEIIENSVFDTLKAYTQVVGCNLAIFRNNIVYTIPGNISNIFVQGTKLIFENNIFNLIGPSSTTLINPSDTIDTLIVRNNLINNFAMATGVIYNSKRGSNFSFNVFKTNVYADLPAIAVAVGTIDSTIHFDIFNNSFLGAPVILEIVNGAPEPAPVVSLNYNNVWDAEEVVTYEFPGYFDSVGNIYCDPMHMGGDDYHLQAYSPLIDAGDPGILDLDSTRSDIGLYGGPLGEVYVYQDLPPQIPDSLNGQVENDSVFIIWHYNTEADFNHYRLHRDTVSGFTPSLLNLIAEPDTSFYVDTDISTERSLYYRISAMDNQGNESDYSDELEVIFTGIRDISEAEVPFHTSIMGNYPNPFNNRTVIRYNVGNIGPFPVDIRLEIYDLLGKTVRTIVKKSIHPGEHSVIWDGRDNAGNELSSGVYFVKIIQWEGLIESKPKKMMLLK